MESNSLTAIHTLYKYKQVSCVACVSTVTQCYGEVQECLNCLV